MRHLSVLAAALLGLSAPLAAQTGTPVSAKKPLTQDTYDLWRSIQGATLSADGRWAAYSVSPAVGDGELVLRATGAATEHRVPRGFLGRPALTVSGGGGGPLPAAQFSADSRFAAVMTYAPMADFERARLRKPRPGPQPRANLAIVALADGQVTRVERVKSFRLPAEGGRHIAFLLEGPDTTEARRDRDSTAAAAQAPAPGAAAAAPGGAARPVAGDSGARRARRKETGTVLVVRDLAAGTEVRVDDVLEYEFDRNGRWLAYTVSSRDTTRDGAYVRDLGAGRETALLTGRGNYRQLAFDRAGGQVAFLSDRDEYAADKPRYALYHATLPAGRAAAAVSAQALPADVIVADRGAVSFVRDGGAVLFGVAPAPLDSVPADQLADKAVFDLWHYKDARLQPQQIVEVGRDRSRSYQAIWHVKSKRFVRLADDSLPQVQVTDDGRVALAVTNVPYSIESMWGEGGSDVYLVNAATGARTPIATRLESRAQLSPGGRYVVWFEDGRWRSHAVATGRTVDLTGGLAGVRFDQETWDTPSTPAAWGVGGWTTNDERVLVYDRYDVWELDPSGQRAARMVTDSAGRRGSLVLRLVDLEREERWVDPAKPLLLRAFNEETKASGFFEDRLGVVQPPRQIVMGDRNYGAPQRAKDADVFLLTQQTVAEFPDLWVGPSLTSLTKISNANPQQSEYRWASVELVKWRSMDGVELKGLLYKPEGFDPSKQYPMVTYFYESLSDGLHNYVVPAGRNVVNGQVYASLGYLVFMPDIAYTTGFPGRSALHSIVPGIQSLIARGIVDPKAIGTAGQSWGGYQTAWMITQTNLFKAAMAGAPVANMTSAYGGIRWESGVARAFQYEKTQSRIGESMWDNLPRYIENSPLFYVDQIRTPLLMMHNDGDGAVPWYQGIEMFVAMRRFGKEVYMVNYNGDAHNPRKRANQKDIDMRMQQFFGHHLKGEPMPDWMRSGIPFLQKGRDQIANTPAATAPVSAGANGTGGGQPPKPR